MLFEKDKSDSKLIKLLIDNNILINWPEGKVVYHGRARKKSETSAWFVDPTFNSSGNATGNQNIYGITTISAGSKELATQFANARAKEIGGTPEVNKIVATRKNCYIFNTLTDISKLPKNTQTEILKAFNSTLPKPMVGAPVNFKFRNIAEHIYKTLLKQNIQHLLSTETNPDNIKNIQNTNPNFYIISSKVVDLTLSEIQSSLLTKSSDLKQCITDIAGAHNSRLLIPKYLTSVMNKYALTKNADKRSSFLNGNYPLNHTYTANVLKELNIIGTRSKFYSATLDKSAEAMFLFDITKVNTPEKKQELTENVLQTYNPISQISKSIFKNSTVDMDSFSRASTKNIMKYFGNHKFTKRFEDSAMVSEGFTLQEHTETCLNVFDQSFQGKVPNDLVPLIKTAIIIHDFEKGKQSHNNQNSKDFLHKTLGLSKNAQELVSYIAHASQKYTTDYHVYNVSGAAAQLFIESKKALKAFLNSEPSTEQIKGLMGVCEIMQTCDSASYTPYATTRTENFAYYNENVIYAQSFKKPTGLTNSEVELKKPSMLTKV